MSVIGSGGSSSALSVLTISGLPQLQQRIVAKVVMDQMESEAAMVSKLVNSSNQSGAGSHIDFRA